MPSMPRKKSKATNIAFRILGVPDNLKKCYPKPPKSKYEKMQEKLQKEMQQELLQQAIMSQGFGDTNGIL